jgi:hypothetical protein
MAKQVITLLTDDLDGGEADRTVEFGLDGVNYTIDLSEKNAGKLRKALDPFLNAATRVGRTPDPPFGAGEHRPCQPRPEPGDSRVGEQERLRGLGARPHPEPHRGGVPQQAIVPSARMSGVVDPGGAAFVDGEKACRSSS